MRQTNRAGAVMALLAACAALPLTGCQQTGSYYTCDDPIKGSGDPCPEHPAADCSGQCVPRTELGWFEPSLLWYGPPDQEPPCPDAAPFIGYQGHADLGQLPLPCATCICDPPEATCTVPTEWAAHSAFPCDAPGAQTLPFSAPAGWDGACTPLNAIPPGQSCGGVPCVQSLSIAAPTLITGACTPRSEEPVPFTDISWPWATAALACTGTAYSPCADPSTTCAPAPPPAAGFLTCIFHEGDQECPDAYPDKHLFYQDVEDHRSCTDCACGAPTGASCTVMASVFTDNACTTLLNTDAVSSSGPSCGSVPAGSGLGSKSAVLRDINPGACPPSGGESIGTIAPSEPSTFCCLP